MKNEITVFLSIALSKLHPDWSAEWIALSTLTIRELEILRRAWEGKGDGEIALLLGLRLHEVEKNLESILTKLGVNDSDAAAQVFECIAGPRKKSAKH